MHTLPSRHVFDFLCLCTFFYTFSRNSFRCSKSKRSKGSQMSLKFILLLSPAYIQGVVKVIDMMVSISLSAERPFRLNPLLLVPLVLNRVAEPGRPFVAFTRRFDLLLDLRLISTPDPSIPLEPSSPSYYIDRYFRINTWLTQTFMETRTVNCQALCP